MAGQLNVSVVLPASGSGERMCLSTPKQFCEAMGRPVISHTIQSFESIPWVNKVIIVVSPDRRAYMEDILENFHSGNSELLLVSGGSSRHRSIFNGIKMVSKVDPDCEVVVVHDGVRPLVDEATLKAVADAALEHGAAGAVRPLVSTVISTDGDGFLDHSLDRLQHKASEMPQAFRLDVITTAYQRSTDYDLDYGTECLHLTQNYAGVRVKLIEGPADLWKVTYMKDLYSLEGTVRERTSDTCLVGFQLHPELGDEIRARLELRGVKVTRGSDKEEMSNRIILHPESMAETAESGRVGEESGPETVRRGGRRSVVFLREVASSVGDTSVEAEVTQLRRHLQTLPKHCGSMSVSCGILFQKESALKMAELVASLVWQRDPVMDGQVFVVLTEGRGDGQ